VLERDVRHFGQIAVEQVGEILRFELVGGLGEVDDVREEDGQFLAVRRDLDILRTGEDRVVDLREVDIFLESASSSLFFCAMISLARRCSWPMALSCCSLRSLSRF
jgi:hypothetical protein